MNIVSFPIKDILSYGLMIANFISLIIFTYVIRPTYKEHIIHKEQHPINVLNSTKILEIHKDYINRISPQALELERIKEERNAKVDKAIIDINHAMNQLSLQLTIALKRKEDEPDWDKFSSLIDKLNNKL